MCLTKRQINGLFNLCLAVCTVGLILMAVANVFSGCEAGTASVHNVASSENENNQNVIINPEEQDCLIECILEPDGTIKGIKECTGSSATLVLLDSLDHCDSVFEVGADSES